MSEVSNWDDCWFVRLPSKEQREAWIILSEKENEKNEEKS